MLIVHSENMVMLKCKNINGCTDFLVRVIESLYFSTLFLNVSGIIMPSLKTIVQL